MAYYFQQCGILTSVDSDEPVQPLFKFRNFMMMFGQKLHSHIIYKRQAKARIRLRVCAGWSEPMLVANTTLWDISCRGSNEYLHRKTNRWTGVPSGSSKDTMSHFLSTEGQKRSGKNGIFMGRTMTLIRLDAHPG